MNKIGTLLIKLLKAEALIKEGSGKNWLFLFILLFFAVIMIYSAQKYDIKLAKLKSLIDDEELARASYLRWMSNNGQYKLQSNIEIELKELGLEPSLYPPKRIIIEDE